MASSPLSADQATAIRQARDELLAGLAHALQRSRCLDARGPRGGGEDEANYLLAWLPYHLVSGDPNVLTHGASLLADLKRWVVEDCVDGYRPEQEAHHGTEPFMLFLPRFAALTGDDEAVALIRRAAAFARNAVPGQPQWYDTTRGVFLSYQLGSRVADRDAQFRYEVADHLRFLHLALAAHRLGGDQDAAEWALHYGRAKARRLVETADPLPIAWDLEGRPLRTQMGNCHGLPGDPCNGVEDHLASGVVQALADCWALDPDPCFRAAARRIIDAVVHVLDDPYHDVAAAAVRCYRLRFGDDHYDGTLRRAITGWSIQDTRECLVLPGVAERSRHGSGFGRRKDMVRWYIEDDAGGLMPSRAISPASAVLAWELTGDPAWALHALRVAGRRTGVALRGLRSGREHADMGSSVAAVMAGHGRCWGIGAVTGCLQPLLLGGDIIAGVIEPARAYDPEVLVRQHRSGAIAVPITP